MRTVPRFCSLFFGGWRVPWGCGYWQSGSQITIPDFLAERQGLVLAKASEEQAERARTWLKWKDDCDLDGWGPRKMKRSATVHWMARFRNHI